MRKLLTSFVLISSISTPSVADESFSNEDSVSKNILEITIPSSGVSGCRKGRKPTAGYKMKVSIKGMEVGDVEPFQLFAAVPVRKQPRCPIKCEFMVEKTAPNRIATFPRTIQCNAAYGNDYLDRMDYLVSDLPDTNIWREVTLHSDWLPGN